MYQWVAIAYKRFYPVGRVPSLQARSSVCLIRSKNKFCHTYPCKTKGDSLQKSNVTYRANYQNDFDFSMVSKHFSKNTSLNAEKKATGLRFSFYCQSAAVSVREDKKSIKLRRTLYLRQNLTVVREYFVAFSPYSCSLKTNTEIDSVQLNLSAFIL